MTDSPQARSAVILAIIAIAGAGFSTYSVLKGRATQVERHEDMARLEQRVETLTAEMKANDAELQKLEAQLQKLKP